MLISDEGAPRKLIVTFFLNLRMLLSPLGIFAMGAYLKYFPEFKDMEKHR